MKKWLANVMSISMLFAFAACGSGNGGGSTGGGPLAEITVDSVQEGYVRYDVTQSNGRTTEGFGTQFDTCIIEPENVLTNAEWNIQVNALKAMNLQNVRIRFYPEMYERGNDNNNPSSFDYSSSNVNFNSLEMQGLYKLLDVFEANNVKVDLSWYGCRTTFVSQDGQINGSWLGGVYGQNGINSWMVAPSLTSNPNEEFAESVAACLNYLVTDKQYTCIYEYSLFPEPEGVIRSMDDFKSIADMVDSKLKGYGIRDKFLFSGPADYNNNAEVYDEKYLSKFDFDKATSSVYPFNASSSNEEMLAFAQSYVAVCDKYDISWGIAECGTSNFIDPVHNSDSDTYDRAHFMARFLVNMLNGGCTNIKYFVFSDCYYDGTLNELGLFKFRHEDWKAKPVWYSWSLLCRYTDFGSEIYPITDSYTGEADKDVAIVALKLPDGSWTYIATNSGNASKKIALVNGRQDRAKTMQMYSIKGSSIPESGELSIVQSSKTVPTEEGVAYFSVPANGIIVLSSKA